MTEQQIIEQPTAKLQKVTKPKNPLRVEQGRKLVEYNRRKKDELKRLNDHITNQEREEHKVIKQEGNSYKYIGIGVGLLLVGGYIMYNQVIPVLSKKTQPTEEPKIVTSKPRKDIFIME